MRLLVINPNTSRGVTDRIDEAAQAVARPADVFTTVCPAQGPDLIVTTDDAARAKRAVVETVQAYDAPCDGIVLASFGNTGAAEVQALRPDIPVIGIARAAFAAARAIGGPFGIVTFGKGLVPGLLAGAQAEGLSDTLLGISYVPRQDFGDPATVQHRYHAELADLCNQMHRRGAESIVMGGGPLAGLAPRLAAEVATPLIDGTQSAIDQIRRAVDPQSQPAPHTDAPVKA